jgi:RTX calcium-binding nonapeptide repeat (4 copies)
MADRPGSLIKGDDKDNILTGTKFDDRIFGYGGDDILRGGPGSDYLQGGPGSDYLQGGGGEDPGPSGPDPRPDPPPDPKPDGGSRYAFGRDDGHDTITGFDPGCPICDVVQPPDRIILLGGRPEDITALIDGAMKSERGDAILTYGDTTVTLAGVSPDVLYSDLFVLA